MLINCDTERYIDEVIKNGEYRYLFEDLVVMDIGCEIGTFALWIYPLAKQIYAIDISKENIDNLDKTITENNLSKIKTYNCAIAGSTGMRSFAKCGGPESAGGGAWELTAQGGDGDIQAYSLNDFMEKEGIEHIDVLKMDTEGTENEIVSAPDFPKDKISWVIGETHRNGSIRPIMEMNGYHSVHRESNLDNLSGHFLFRK